MEDIVDFVNSDDYHRMQSYDEDDMINWLNCHGFSAYIDTFQQHQMLLWMLPTLTSFDFDILGFNVTDRERMRSAINSFRYKHSSQYAMCN
ncbi:sterile alpha motif domain protein [Fadolivirus algeromassiliense]|jgi:hypothetical protein|uniref:Sterile alpha motif domain protein n=1 Tax=Fadolivirus FV1/VV64 TaxID=3070911 RepID=A0A7D3QWF3_9VIRU|nr:sterile alpha motif domain protein [Fadolivirus algeromassiliense]QKF94499.1 sterile alpha motif domain protein [Fadolivirus FV1/VV64]